MSKATLQTREPKPTTTTTFYTVDKELSTQVAEYEATTFSIFYNNSLFLALVIIASFYLLNGTSAHVNYLLSIGLSSGLIALLSTGTQS